MSEHKNAPEHTFCKEGIFYFRRRVPRDLSCHYTSSQIAFSLRHGPLQWLQPGQPEPRSSVTSIGITSGQGAGPSRQESPQDAAGRNRAFDVDFNSSDRERVREVLRG